MPPSLPLLVLLVVLVAPPAVPGDRRRLSGLVVAHLLAAPGRRAAVDGGRGAGVVHEVDGAAAGEPAPHPVRAGVHGGSRAVAVGAAAGVAAGNHLVPVEPVLLPPGDPDVVSPGERDPGLVRAGRVAAHAEAHGPERDPRAVVVLHDLVLPRPMALVLLLHELLNLKKGTNNFLIFVKLMYVLWL